MKDERGSAAIWVTACCALVMVVSVIEVIRAAAVLARHRAEAAADVAALAAAGRLGTGDAPCPWAVRLAERNGAVVQSCRVRLDATGRSGTVDVVVRLDLTLPVVGGASVTASARAGRASR